MRSNITDDDEGKNVVNADGEKVGMVTEVRGGTAHVDPDPGVTDKIKSKLGWGDTNDDTYPLQEANVDAVTDDEIRLRRDL
ncbi:PRC-barrel domain containing protein [Halostella sp. PRR32]|uniref:PRC-barrel domain containing protein n=1 Tax=Halostella sp. PRR32 TaxID=3098147 RepID=UPI002B1DFBD9|nr:PRC-barrel domain containing protein [Halostella sp. PRR32]